jgi:hypothetical protein
LALFEYLAMDGELHAVVARDGAVRLHRLGAVVETERDRTALRYGLRRLAYEFGSVTTRTAANTLVEHKARSLDRLLFEPLFSDIGDHPLVVVPTGLPAVRPGDELLGLAAALLGIGVKSLVASVVPVPDDASRPLMLRLHRHLRAGASPATALAMAQRDFADVDPMSRVAVNGFPCYGTG